MIVVVVVVAVVAVVVVVVVGTLFVELGPISEPNPCFHIQSGPNSMEI